MKKSNLFPVTFSVCWTNLKSSRFLMPRTFPELPSRYRTEDKNIAPCGINERPKTSMLGLCTDLSPLTVTAGEPVRSRSTRCNGGDKDPQNLYFLTLSQFVLLYLPHTFPKTKAIVLLLTTDAYHQGILPSLSQKLICLDQIFFR